jgi:hypothetical protein
MGASLLVRRRLLHRLAIASKRLDRGRRSAMMQTTADALRARRRLRNALPEMVTPPNLDPPASAASLRCGTFIEGPP